MKELLITAISSGSMGSLLTWMASRRQRNNDFIADLQNSIGLLTENYTKTLDELIVVKRQNTELLLLVNDLQGQIQKLKDENATLIKKLNELKCLLKNQNQS
jgi:archaellum component FlaC